MDALFSSPFLLLVQVCKLRAPPLPSSTTAAVASSQFHDTITFWAMCPVSVTLTGHIESEMKKKKNAGARGPSGSRSLHQWWTGLKYLVFYFSFIFGLRSILQAFCYGQEQTFLVSQYVYLC